MRIVSLVPSLTETVFALGCGADEVVGRTAWCIHPADVVESIPKLGGTKTPNVERIAKLAPDIVLLDVQENRAEDFERLVAVGVPAWYSDVKSVDDVAPLLRSLGGVVGRPAEGRELASRLEATLATIPVRERRPCVMPLIWNEPLMAVGPERYAGDLLVRCGFDVPALPSTTGYPEVTPRKLGEERVEILLLSSEPYDFSEAEGEALADAVAAAGFPRPRAIKIDGEALTWFGARTEAAVSTWLESANSILLEQ